MLMSEWMAVFCRSWSGKSHIPWTGWQEVQEVGQQEAVLWSWAPVGRKLVLVLISALALCSWQSLCLILWDVQGSTCHLSRQLHSLLLLSPWLFTGDKGEAEKEPGSWYLGTGQHFYLNCLLSRESPGTVGICFLEDLKYIFIDYSNFEIMMEQSSETIGKVLSPHLTAVFIAASYESKYPLCHSLSFDISLSLLQISTLI